MANLCLVFNQKQCKHTSNVSFNSRATTRNEAKLSHLRLRRKKDTWCDMAHSVVYHQAWVWWLVCNHIMPKAIAPFWMTCWMCSFGITCHHQQTGSPSNNTLSLIHTWLSPNHSGWVDGQTLTTVEETRHLTHLHTIQLSNPSLFFPLSTLYSASPWLEAIMRQFPHFSLEIV